MDTLAVKLSIRLRRPTLYVNNPLHKSRHLPAISDAALLHRTLDLSQPSLELLNFTD